MKLWSIEGNRQRLDGGAMFGNVPRALWQQWLPPDDQHRVDLACRALLVRDLEGRNVLFDTGVGDFFEPKLKERFGISQDGHRLLDSLASAGLGHDEIDVVVLSHLHFDHAGGLLASWREDQAPQLLFPRARFLVGAEHWRRAREPHPRDRASFIPELIDLLAGSGRLELVSGAHSDTLGGAVRFHASHGHTPGLLLGEVVAGAGDRQARGGIVFCADLIPGRAWLHLPVSMGYDRYPERLIDEKRAFLDDMLAREVRLFFTHDPHIAMVRVARDERGRYLARDEQAQLRGIDLPGAG